VKRLVYIDKRFGEVIASVPDCNPHAARLLAKCIVSDDAAAARGLSPKR
jgi:hypothetical protein